MGRAERGPYVRPASAPRIAGHVAHYHGEQTRAARDTGPRRTRDLLRAALLHPPLVPQQWGVCRNSPWWLAEQYGGEGAGSERIDWLILHLMYSAAQGRAYASA